MFHSEQQGLTFSTSPLPNAPQAFDIVNEMLSKTGQAISERNFELFAECIALPSVVETFEGVLHVRNMDMMRRMFDRNVAFYHEARVHRIERNCTTAEYLRPDQIACTYETTVSHSKKAVKRAPYTAYCMLQNFDGAWLVTHAQYAISDSAEHCNALVLTLRA